MQSSETDAVKARHLVVPALMIGAVVAAAVHACLAAQMTVVPIAISSAARPEPSTLTERLTRRIEELTNRRDELTDRLAQFQSEKAGLDRQIAQAEEELVSELARVHDEGSDAEPDAAHPTAKRSSFKEEFLEGLSRSDPVTAALLGFNDNADAKGYLDDLQEELLAVHPFLDGVSRADFGLRVLASLRQLAADEPELAARADVDRAQLERAFEWDSFVTSWFEEGQGDADPQVDARVELAASALVDAVNDPFTRRLRGDHAFNLSLMLEAQFPSEIGLLLEQDARGGAFVRDVLRDTDASAKGVRAGDRVVAVNGEPTQDVPLRKLEERVARRCRLTLERDGFDGPVDVELFAFDPTQMGVRACRVTPDVGYLSFSMFNGAVYGALTAEARRLLKEGAQALVLDVRGNPGGLVAESVAIANLFLPKGVEVTEIVQREGKKLLPDAYWSANPTFGPQVPLVLLIDRCSASASELLAGALQINRRALLIGEPTFGKGIGQTLRPLVLARGGGSTDLPRIDLLWVTSLRFLSPGGRDHHGVGIPPDLVAPRPADSRARMQARAGFLGDASLLERIAALDLGDAGRATLRTPGPPPPALLVAAGLADRPFADAEIGEGLKDVARLVQAANHPELGACPDLDPALAKAISALRLALRRAAAR